MLPVLGRGKELTERRGARRLPGEHAPASSARCSVPAGRVGAGARAAARLQGKVLTLPHCSSISGGLRSERASEHCGRREGWRCARASAAGRGGSRRECSAPGRWPLRVPRAQRPRPVRRDSWSGGVGAQGPARGAAGAAANAAAPAAPRARARGPCGARLPALQSGAQRAALRHLRRRPGRGSPAPLGWAAGSDARDRASVRPAAPRRPAPDAEHAQCRRPAPRSAARSTSGFRGSSGGGAERGGGRGFGPGPASRGDARSGRDPAAGRGSTQPRSGRHPDPTAVAGACVHPLDADSRAPRGIRNPQTKGHECSAASRCPALGGCLSELPSLEPGRGLARRVGSRAEEKPKSTGPVGPGRA